MARNYIHSIITPILAYLRTSLQSSLRKLPNSKAIQKMISLKSGVKLDLMKKINHAYKNFDIDKFLQLLKDCKHTSTREFIMDIIIPSIDGYNSSDDEDGYFQMYLEELVITGEFFVKLKKYFTISHFCENCIYEDGYWNAAFVLFCKKDKIHRLFNIAYERDGNHEVYVLDAISDSKIKKVNDLYHMKILDNHTKKIWKDAEKSWDEVYKEFDSPKYTRVKNFNYGKKFYEEHHSEGMEFEHKDNTPDGKTPNEKTVELESK